MTLSYISKIDPSLAVAIFVNLMKNGLYMAAFHLTWLIFNTK